MQQPKNIVKRFKIRNGSFGKERRMNMVKQTLYKQPIFPKIVDYDDIDQAFFDWVDKKLEFTYDNTKYPTYKLFSNQRISEYGQAWEKLDEKGNLEVNFKAISRENNPQVGKMHGGFMNIPGHREYPIFENYVTDENGYEHKDVYTMKQPTMVDFVYKINLITSFYKALNLFNSKIQKEFNAINCYLFPNGFAMSMSLNSVDDESEYTIDDRKYYSQTYQIKLSGYIIQNEDYTVHSVPIRTRNTFVVGMNSGQTKQKSFNLAVLQDKEEPTVSYVKEVTNCVYDNLLEVEKAETTFEEIYCPTSGHSEVEFEELQGMQKCWADTDDEIYVNSKVSVNISFTECDKECEFEMDSDLELENIALHNIKSFHIILNGDELDIEDSDITFEEGDRVKVTVELDNPLEKASVCLLCYDPEDIIDMTGEDGVKIENIDVK